MRNIISLCDNKLVSKDNKNILQLEFAFDEVVMYEEYLFHTSTNVHVVQ